MTNERKKNKDYIRKVSRMLRTITYVSNFLETLRKPSSSTSVFFIEKWHYFTILYKTQNFILFCTMRIVKFPTKLGYRSRVLRYCCLRSHYKTIQCKVEVVLYGRFYFRKLKSSNRIFRDQRKLR